MKVTGQKGNPLLRIEYRGLGGKDDNLSLAKMAFGIRAGILSIESYGSEGFLIRNSLVGVSFHDGVPYKNWLEGVVLYIIGHIRCINNEKGERP